jgi:outer membrane receptor for ferrienterochelin and colicins
VGAVDDQAPFGQAFRAPNAYENFYESVLNKRNPSLGPETIRSYEVVYEHQWNQHWRSTTSVFYNDIHDLIAYRLDPADDLYFFDNLDAVVAKGGEIEIEGRWANGLLGRASYAFTQTEDAGTGLRLSNSPEHVAKLSLSVPLWQDKIFASAELQAMSQRDTVRGGNVGGVWLANTTLFSRELVKGLEVSATLYNLFNQRYGDPVPEDFRQDSIRQDGRTFRLKMTYRF